MAAVLEKVSTPALELVEADALFENEALAAWEEYQLTGYSGNSSFCPSPARISYRLR